MLERRREGQPAPLPGDREADRLRLRSGDVVVTPSGRGYTDEEFNR